MDIVTTFLGVVVGVIVLTVLVVLHELGHAIAARRADVEVKEFGIGFPPRAWARKLKNGTLFTLNWLPIGGFVRLKGEYDSAKGNNTYGSRTFWQKTKILLAGVAMNWLTAIVLFTFAALIGLPKLLPNQFTMPGDTQYDRTPVKVLFVAKDSPAEKAGLMPGDEILIIDNTVVNTSDELAKLTEKYKGQTVELTYERNGQQQTDDVSLNAEAEKGKGYLGVSSGQAESIRATWSAPIVGIATTAQFTAETYSALGSLVGNTVNAIIQKLSFNTAVQKDADKALAEAGNSVTGPLGIFGSLFPNAIKAGVPGVLTLAAVISLSLAVMNSLPIPALDGGRWTVTALFKVGKKKLTKEMEEKIHGTGMLVLLGLIVLITFLDIGKLFG